MAEIAPLKPLRYDLSRVDLAKVVAPPYDVISPADRAELAARDPHNVVHLDLPEGEGDAKYHHAAKLLAEWRSAGVLVRDDEPAFYRYEQTFAPPGGGAKKKRRGFLGLVRLVALDQGIVLPHERTLAGPKLDRLKLSRATKASLSPGFMLYRDPARALDAALEKATPLVEITTPDGIHHALAKLSDPSAIAAIVSGVATSKLLIADGHHRYSTALEYVNETTSAGVPNPEQQFFMTFFANGDDPDLVVFPTHRLVHSLPKADYDAMLEGVREIFDVKTLASSAPAPALLAELAASGQKRPSLVACAPDGRVALLALKDGVDLAKHSVLGATPEVLRRTDVALLHMGILEPVLGVTRAMQEAKTNIFYPQDASAALRDLHARDEKKGQMLFLMNGTPVEQVRRVAEAGEVMPQKSTFFFPKVLTGLAIHTLDPSRQVPVAG
ncbi:MAG TPA: DUF1015 domain-containing protein [Labilithrix sp.]|jgi:uncharacterized protein (DUF1015 family)